jgi:hypothetical protein
MRPHGPAGVVFVADHLCIKTKKQFGFVVDHLCIKKKKQFGFCCSSLVYKRKQFGFVFDQMVSRCQRRCIRVLCSGSCDFLLFHMCSARSPQFFSNGLAHFPCRLCKSQNIFPAWLSSIMVLAQHFFAQFACLLPEAPKRSIAKLRALHLPEQKKSIINMI